METESSQVITVKLRVSSELKEKIAESAKSFNRSMNADMVARLEQSFTSDAQSIKTEDLLAILAERFVDKGYEVKMVRRDSVEETASISDEVF